MAPKVKADEHFEEDSESSDSNDDDEDEGGGKAMVSTKTLNFVS
jgi:hypothetical protein